MSKRILVVLLALGVIQFGCAPAKKQVETAPTKESKPSKTYEEVGAGTLSIEQMEGIEMTISSGLPALSACYGHELDSRGTKSWEGKILFKILIATNGSVANVLIGQSELKSQPMYDCMLETIRGWEFPAVESATWFTRSILFSPAY
ncbi:MAG: AgmX/PglI C-terminal domain-containing protein [Pseudomonadota bacterium]